MHQEYFNETDLQEAETKSAAFPGGSLADPERSRRNKNSLTRALLLITFLIMEEELIEKLAQDQDLLNQSNRPLTLETPDVVS